MDAVWKNNGRCGRRVLPVRGRDAPRGRGSRPCTQSQRAPARGPCRGGMHTVCLFMAEAANVECSYDKPQTKLPSLLLPFFIRYAILNT